MPESPYTCPATCEAPNCGAPVKSRGILTTDIGFRPKDGHRHNPNVHTWMGTCEKGHKLMARGYAPCPVEGCRYGESESWKLGWKDSDE